MTVIKGTLPTAYYLLLTVYYKKRMKQTQVHFIQESPLLLFLWFVWVRSNSKECVLWGTYGEKLENGSIKIIFFEF